MKHKIKCEKTEKGVTIWVNGRWVLDASLFNEEMSLAIDTKKMKKQKLRKGWESHQGFRYDKRMK